MAKKSLVGRPPVIDKDVLNKLEISYSMGCSDLEACLYANISKQTLYNYQEKHPEFKDRKEMLKEKLVLKARTVIADSLNNKDENTAKWYLERKKRDEFSTKIENEVTGKGINIVVADNNAKHLVEDV